MKIAPVVLSLLVLPGTALARDAAGPAPNPGAIVDAEAQLSDPVVAPPLDRFSTSLGLTTFGPTVEVGYRFSRHFGLRAAFGGFDYSGSGEFEDGDIEGEISGRGAGLIGDLRPTGGAFRLSAGVFHADYTASAEATNVSFDNGATGALSLDMDTRRTTMPMIGLGLDGKIVGPVSGTLEVGALFGDGFDVTGTSSTPGIPRDVVDAEIADIADDFRNVDVLPFLHVAIGVKF
mgnify:CR=1 FL=1